MEVFGLLIGLLVIVGVFLIIREFWCWFYKSNEILSKVDEISSQVKALSRKLEELSQKVDDLSKNH